MIKNDNIDKPVCTFLFGAGADSQFGLKNGNGFNEALLANQFSKERKMLLGEECASHKFIYPNSISVFLQTMLENEDDAIEKIGTDIFKKCQHYYETKDETLRKEIKDYCRSWFNKITDTYNQPTTHIATDAEKVFFLKNATFFTALDEKFNDLRHPKVSTKGKRVINAYYIVFILMLQSVFCLDGLSWNLESIWQLLRSSKYNVDYTKNSYYKTLSTAKVKCNIITTNYTLIAEHIIKQPITYLHGNLCWFEDFEKLIVYDCKNDADLEALRSNPKHIVPFILIPSGIKPLICTKQIEQFHNFVESLNKTRILCVVGYKFNSEDNHINSIIAEWLRKPNHRIIYLNYKDEMNWNKCTWANNFFNVKTIRVNSSGDLNNILSINAQIVDIITDGNNSQKVFDAIMRILENVQYQ
jgi:hypothetical protein